MAGLWETVSTSSTAISLGLVTVSLTIGYFIYYNKYYSFFRKKGIPGPTPIPILGTAYDFLIKIMPDSEMERYEKFGKLYGAYEMHVPVLNISDPTIIKDIMVRDFVHFADRRARQSTNKIFKHFLTQLRGDDWKRARNTLTPTFTSGKMKSMLLLMKEASDELNNSMVKKAENKEYIDVKDLFGFYTMDVVAKCAFATETNVQRDGYDNEFMYHAGRFLTPPKWRIVLGLLLPRVAALLISMRLAGGQTISYLEQVVRTILDQRRKEGECKRSYRDMLQLMIDALSGKLIEDKEEANSLVTDAESHHVHEDAKANGNGHNGMNGHIDTHKKNTNHVLSEDEVVANAVLVLAAGYETTATLLTYASYCLAMNQDKQDKLRSEVSEAFEAAGKELKYEDISSLKYLDSVVTETLRMFSPVLRLERQCTMDYEFTSEVKGHSTPMNIKVKEGEVVRFPIWAIHHDEQYYPRPYSFQPERWMPENRDKLTPYTYLPFGGGPRNCIGMRFALLEAKLALASTILQFRYVPCDKTPKYPDMTKAGVLLSAKNVIIKVQKL